MVFSTKMKTEFIDISLINTTLLDLYIDPADQRDSDEGFNLSSVNASKIGSSHDLQHNDPDAVLS